MLSRFKQYFWFALAFGVFYFLLIHHIIFFSFTDFELMKKVEPTLQYTFFSLKQSNPSKVLRIDSLRNAGIEEIMLDRGIISEDILDRILNQIDDEQARQEQ